MRKFVALSITIVAVAAANAQLGTGTLETFADSNINGDAPDAVTTLGSGRTYNVISGGTVGGTTGIRFMSIQGINSGTFARWAMIEFDPSEVLGELQTIVDNTPGATGFEVTDVTFRAQQQFTQPFTARSGALELYHADDDATSPFSFSGADYFTNSPLGTLNTVDDSFGYVTMPGINFDFNETGSNYSSVVADWNSGTDTIRMVLNPGDSNVVAPFKGSSSPFGGLNAPSMFVSYNIIPEPTSLALLALAGLLIRRR